MSLIPPLLITNNQKAVAAADGKLTCRFLEEGTYMDVLYAVRDQIHLGHQLLTHPMAGSVKPNQTPFRSIVLDGAVSPAAECWESVELIENSIAAAQKFFTCRATPHWPEKIRNDFATIDLSFIQNFLDHARKCQPGA
ncbi:MAG: GrdX family protein [Oscillospiraceae bacterium]